MKAKQKRKWRDSFVWFEVLFMDVYRDIMYIALITFFVLILSALFAQKQSTYIIVFSIHILSLYIPYLLIECLERLERFIREIFSMKKVYVGVVNHIKIGSVVKVINIILIMYSFIDKVAIPVILVVIISLVISNLTELIVAFLVVDDDAITICGNDTIANKKIQLVLKLIFMAIPYIMILISLYFMRWNIIAKIIFFICYCITTLTIEYLSENIMSLDDVIFHLKD